MDTKSQSRINRKLDVFATEDTNTRQRLAWLINANSEIERQKRMFRSDTERREAELMVRPMEPKAVFAWFGLLLGTLPPAAIFSKFIINSGIHPVILSLMVLVILTTAATGYFSGKVTAILVRQVERSTLS